MAHERRDLLDSRAAATREMDRDANAVHDNAVASRRSVPCPVDSIPVALP